MPRILLNTTPLVSRKFISSVQQTINLREDLLRVKNIMDEITNGGVSKAALETSPEVTGGGPALAAGEGAILYDAVVTLLGGVNSASVTNILKQFDQG
jgi:hypothetical protein